MSVVCWLAVVVVVVVALVSSWCLCRAAALGDAMAERSGR